MTESKFSQGFERMKADLLRARDELKVQMHLASMDAKDAWTKLEPRVRAFEEQAQQVAVDTADELEKVAGDLAEELEKLQEKIRKS